jgi:hypothetical protein
MVQKLKLGTIDLALPSSVMTSESDLFGIFELPYLVQDRKHMQRIEKDIVWPVLAPEAEKKGLKILGVWENGYRHITNNKRPRFSKTSGRSPRSRAPNPPTAWKASLQQVTNDSANSSPHELNPLTAQKARSPVTATCSIPSIRITPTFLSLIVSCSNSTATS